MPSPPDKVAVLWPSPRPAAGPRRMADPAPDTAIRIRPPWRSITRASRGRSAGNSSPSRAPVAGLRPRTWLLTLHPADPQPSRRLAASETPSHNPWGIQSCKEEAQPAPIQACQVLKRKLPSTIRPREPADQGIASAAGSSDQRPLADRLASTTQSLLSPPGCETIGLTQPGEASAPDPARRPGLGSQPQRHRPAHTFRANHWRSAADRERPKAARPCQRQRPPAGPMQLPSVRSRRLAHHQLAGRTARWPDRQAGATEGAKAQNRATCRKAAQCQLMSGQTPLAQPPTAGPQPTTSNWQRSFAQLGSNRQRLALRARPKRWQDASPIWGGVSPKGLFALVSCVIHQLSGMPIRKTGGTNTFVVVEAFHHCGTETARQGSFFPLVTNPARCAVPRQGSRS